MATKAGTNPQSAFRRGLRLANDGHDSEAEAAFRDVIAARPDLPEAYMNLGVVLEGQSRYGAAEEVLRKALQLKPGLATCQLALGVAVERQGRYDEAEEAYRAAVQMDPALAEAHLNVGVTLERQGRLAEAETCYRDAIRLKPNLQQAHVDLAAVLDRLGRYSEAEATYRTAIANSPDDPYGRFGLGLSLAKQNRQQEAASAYREAIRLKTDFRAAHSALGLALDLQGLAEQAVAEYRAAIALPIDPDLSGYRAEWDHYKLARSLLTLQHNQEAEVAYRAAILMRPEFPEALVGLADLLNGLGRPEHAEEFARKAEAVPAPAWRSEDDCWKGSAIVASVCVESGEKFHDDDQFEDALAEIKTAQTKMPMQLLAHDREPVAHLSLLRGYALARLGRLVEARNEFRRCLKVAAPNGMVALAAVRNERRLNASLRNRLSVPGWLPNVLSLVVLATVIYSAWLTNQGRLSATDFLVSVGTGVILVFAAFSLPALTQIKIGPAEIQKETSFATAPKLDLFTAVPALSGVLAPIGTADISMRLGGVIRVPMLAFTGASTAPPPERTGSRFDFAVRLHGQTARYKVFVDPAAKGAEAVAEAFLGTCESDFDRIAAYFDKVPSGLPINAIFVDNPNGAYHRSCDATDLYCGVFDPKEVSLMVATALLVDLFGAASDHGWDCGMSFGEGLARVLATERYPNAISAFATAAEWLNSARRLNRVSKPRSDVDPAAIGCVVLFLNYLHYQLKFDWRAIVAAGGTNLAETYRVLTGKDDGFRRFRALMDAQFPLGTPCGLTNDNPFPIAEPAAEPAAG